MNLSSLIDSTPPLDAWCEPFHHEPVHGFFQRLTKRNYQSSTHFLAAAVGLKFIHFDPKELLQFCRKFPLQNFERLVSATPIFTSNGKLTVNGQVFRHGLDWSFEKPRVCGACLYEETFYRTWFDLIAIDRCPFHGIPLESGDGNSSLKWWFSEIGMASDGTSFIQARPRLRDEMAGSWEEYAVNRVIGRPNRNVTALDNAEMHDVIDVLEVIGRVATHGIRKSPRSALKTRQSDRAKVLRRGFEIVAQGETVLDDLLFAIISEGEKHDQQRLIFGVDKYFGAIGRTVFELSDNSAADILRCSLRRVSKRANIYSRRRSSPMAKDANGPLTLRELAMKFAMSPSKMRELAVRLELTPATIGRNGYHSFPSESVQEIEALLADLISREAAQNMLGLSKKDFSALQRAGMFRPFVRIGQGSSAFDQFRLTELKDFVAAARRGVETTPSVACMPLTTYCENTNSRISTTVCRIRDGKLKPIGWDEQKPGLQAYLVPAVAKRPKSVAKFASRSTPKNAGHTFLHAEEIIGARIGCVGALVKLGYLRLASSEAGSPRRTGIDDVSLMNFQKTFIVAKRYARLLGCSKSAAYRELHKLGIHRLSEPELRKYSFVRRADARAVFGKDSDPDQFSDSVTDSFWLALREYLKHTGSHYRVMTEPGSPTASIRASDRLVTALVILDVSSNTITFEVRASMRTERRRYRVLNSSLQFVPELMPDVTVHCDASLITLSVVRNDLSLKRGEWMSIFEWIADHTIAIRSLFSRSDERKLVPELTQTAGKYPVSTFESYASASCGDAALGGPRAGSPPSPPRD